MAVCCAYDCLNAGIPISGLVTFGQPRVANPAMAAYLNERLMGRYLRFMNHKDIVPSVPANGPSFLSDYQHAGQSAWINGAEIERNTRLMKSAPPGDVSGSGSSETEEEPMDELAKLFADSASESPQVDSAENQITTDELNDLQYFLRSAALPTSSAPAMEPLIPAYAATSLQPVLPVRSSLQTPTAQLQGFMSRFNDHSMLEYVRVLNEHHWQEQ